MTFDEWKKAGMPKDIPAAAPAPAPAPAQGMSFEQWKASQAPAAPAKPGYFSEDASTKTGTRFGDDIRDFAAGFQHGSYSPLRGAKQLVTRAFGSKEALQKQLDEEKAAKDALGGVGQATSLAAEVGTAFLPGAALGKAAQVGARAPSIGKAAASGAALGAINPVAGGTADSYDESKLWQAGLGAGLGAGATAAGKALFTPSSSAAVRKASEDFGGLATPGQLMAARGTGFGRHIGELEEQAGRWLAGTGIEKSRGAARSEATKNLVRDVGEQAGLGRVGGNQFHEVLDAAQAAKKGAYDKVAANMSIGNTQQFQQGLTDFVRTSPAVSKLNNQELQTVNNVMRGLFPSSSQSSAIVGPSGRPIATGPGGYGGKDIQKALSDLSAEIKNSFGGASSGSDKRVGEALKAIRGHIESDVKKHSPKGTWEDLQKLNTAHAQLGKIQGAANYKKAIEGGEPRLGDIVQRAGAGAGDRPLSKARQDLVDRAVELEKIGGKGYAHSDLRDIQRLTSFATHLPSFALRGIYNEPMMRRLNKLAQQGDPEALRMLERAGVIGTTIQ